MKLIVIGIILVFWLSFGFEMTFQRTKDITNKWVRLFFCILDTILLPIIIFEDLGWMYGDYFYNHKPKSK